MDRIPTERELLEAIVRRYQWEFYAFDKGKAKRSHRTYIPIDVDAIGSEFGVDGDIVFSQLWHHMDRKYGWDKPNGTPYPTRVPFFSPSLGGDSNCVNYAFAAAILAGLREDHKRHFATVSIAAVSLLVSIIALVVSLAV